MENDPITKRAAKTFFFSLVLVGQLLWLFWSNFHMHGPVLDVSYRREVRKAALYAKMRDPSEENQVRFADEVALLSNYLALTNGGTVLAFLIMDVLLFRGLWLKPKEEDKAA